MTTIEWKGKMAFEATPPSGNRLLMDALPESGGQNLGPTPLEAFVSAVATCSAMDVIYVLKLRHQKVDSYRIEIDGERVEKGTFPRPYSSFKIRHILVGNLDPKEVEEAVKNSDERFCTAIATLRAGPTVTTEWSIEPPDFQ